MSSLPPHRPLSARSAARLARVLLLAGVALFFSLVVFNNTTDFNSNYQFVRHVLLMDSTFPSNRGLWRALHPDLIHRSLYIGIICWEALSMILSWVAVIALIRTRRAPGLLYNRARCRAIHALTAGLMLWLVGFLAIGGEWFMMWQSKIWNGQEAAFRMFTVEALTLCLFLLPDPEN